MMDQTDYQSLIDAPTWGFIRKTDDFYPPDTASRPIAEQRAIYDAMCRQFFQGYPPGITAHDAPVAGVPCRHYPGAGAATVLYLHGGGFVVGGLDSHDDICAEIRARTGLTVVSAAYRLSPEHRHPAAFDDTCAVARTLGGPLVLAGDSAGGNLAAAAALALVGQVDLRGLVMIYPGLGGDLNAGSYLTHAHAPMLTREDVLFYKDIRHGGPPPEEDWTVHPLRAPSLAGLPPTFALSAECDPLADDARLFVDRLKRAGIAARWTLAPGLPHGFLRGRVTVPRAAAAFTDIALTLARLAKGGPP